MRPVSVFSAVLAFGVVAVLGMSVIPHGDSDRTALLRKTPDPRSELEKKGFEERDSISKVAQILAELRAAKLQMYKEGVYLCCIKQDLGCNWCALMEAACDCRNNLKEGKPVCPECKVGWEAGFGAVEGYTAADVRTNLSPGNHPEPTKEERERGHGRERP